MEADLDGRERESVAAGSLGVAFAGDDHPDQLAVDRLQLVEGRLQGAEDLAGGEFVAGVGDAFSLGVEGDRGGPAGAAATGVVGGVAGDAEEPGLEDRRVAEPAQAVLLGLFSGMA